ICAGAVAEPLRRTSDGIDSTISMSRSVAVSFNCPFAASIITLDKIGIVLRRSTTLCTWLSAFRKAPRSTLIFIALALDVWPPSNPCFGPPDQARNPLKYLGLIACKTQAPQYSKRRWLWVKIMQVAGRG